MAQPGQRPERTRPISVRDTLLEHAKKYNLGHVAPSLSTLTILNALDVEMSEEDHLVFSKGHGCYGYWVYLALKDPAFQNAWLNGALPGCLERFPPIVRFSTGSLGMGLPLAAGMAFARKLKRQSGTVYVLTGDGEMQEGSNWEALTFAVTHRLNNLCLLVDYNQLQAMTPIHKCDRQNMADKLTGFGLKVFLAAGHNITGIISALEKPVKSTVKAIILNTIKGYGVRQMEGKAEWHYRPLPKEKP